MINIFAYMKKIYYLCTANLQKILQIYKFFSNK